MWNVIAANRLLDKRNREKQYLKHRKTLSCIKPQIDNLPPPSFDFLTTRPKAKQLAYEKHLEVQANNNDLVRRMVQPRNSTKISRQRPSRNSLHENYFKYKASVIERDNMKLVRRLAGATSFLKFDQMEIDHKKHLKWMESHRKASDNNILRPLSAR